MVDSEKTASEIGENNSRSNFSQEEFIFSAKEEFLGAANIES